MRAPSTLRLPDGRPLAFDDVGDPSGVPVVYLHGTPDSRLARHPDDGAAAAAGVRLLAVDRPGAGESHRHPGADLAGLGHDLAALLDHLDVPRTILFGWSTGGLFALGAATVLGPRVAAMGLAAPVPPVEAYGDPSLVAALAVGRRGFAELALELSPAELAGEVAPFLVPDPLTAASALEHVLESAGEAGRRDLVAVPGAAGALAEGLLASVAQGPAGLVADVALQLEPGLDLSAIRAPVRTFHGSADGVSPPIVGTWLVARLPHAVLDLSPGGSHHLLFPRWRGILRALRRDAAM
ncbi:MAG TPA: alpha/beta hydrolase [Acidimicrobiales bacterium]|nr:alpha/beta hydrolase [Acidimicrobiales bacterium]